MKAAEPEAPSIAVDWTKVERQPFRRQFLDPYQQALTRPEDAAAIRAHFSIDIESDPGGVGLTPAPIRSFSELGALPDWIRQALAENRWDTPMPIQSQALPILLSGRNLVGIAQTGSGKTGAFLVPAIVHANDQRPLWRNDPGPIVLVLSPTRELAVQISDEADKLTYSSRSHAHPDGIRSVCFYGGGRKYEQLKKFTFDGSHIVVATPGRLMDFCREGKVTLQRVTYLCLDEADRMLDMGFRGDMEQIGAAIRPERQTVFFSATWPKEVQALTSELCMDAPITIRVRKPGSSAAGENGEDPQALLASESITQEVVVIDFPGEDKPWAKQDDEKRRRLEAHIKSALQDPEAKMLVFVNQKGFADELSNKLWEEGVHVDAIHGGKPQETRLWVLDKFRKGETRLLIATDVIGRGLDIPKVSHVVVYSINGIEDYVHRIGRTGRGKDGRGHALVFFEYSGTQPDTARELIGLLQRSKQPVPEELHKIAEEMASGKRWARNDSSWGGQSSWSSGGGSSGWRGVGWNGGGSNGGWRGSTWGDQKDGQNGAEASSGGALPRATTLLEQMSGCPT